MIVEDRRPIPTFNYLEGRDGHTIDTIVLHHMDGTMEGADGRFHSGVARASAHLGLALEDERVWLWVLDGDTAYHAGNWDVNLKSIGIECEDKGRDDHAAISPWTGAFYAKLARVVHDKCLQYVIPIDRAHVRAHREVSDSPTYCPGSLDVDRVVRAARLLRAVDEITGAL